MDGRREDTECLLDVNEAIDLAPRAFLSSNDSWPSSPPEVTPFTAERTCRADAGGIEPALGGRVEGLLAVRPIEAGTASVLFRPIVGVVARWMSSAGGGDIGRGGGPMDGPALILPADEVRVGDVVGGGGRRGGGGSIIVGGRVRSTGFGTLAAASVPEGTRERDGSVRAELIDAPVPTLERCAPPSRNAGLSAAAAATPAAVGRATELTPGVFGPETNWNC